VRSPQIGVCSFTSIFCHFSNHRHLSISPDTIFITVNILSVLKNTDKMASSKASQKKQSSKSSSKGGKQRPASAPSQSGKRRAQDSEPPQDARPQKKRRRTTAESSDEEDSEVQLPQKDGSDVEYSNAGEDEDES
jgi:hypothetical protein